MTWRTAPPRGRKFALVATDTDVGFDVAQWEPSQRTWISSAYRDAFGHLLLWSDGVPWHPLPYRAGVSRKTHEMEKEPSDD